MKEFLSFWSPVFALMIIILGYLQWTCNSYYDQGYKEASQGIPYKYCPTSNQFGSSWKNGWKAHQRDRFLDSQEN